MNALLEKLKSSPQTTKTLLFLLSLTFFLRLPSLFEPLWYGDESIYLTIGQQILRGDVLYLDIFDHKTPGIYYFAAFALKFFGSTIWSLRFLMTIWVLSTVIVFFFLSKSLFNSKVAFLATFLLVLLTSTPLLEGNVANSELLMILPISLGIFFGVKNHFFLSGAFFSTAFLLKVPAVFDFAAFFLFVFFSLNFLKFTTTLKNLFRLLLGFLTPLILSFIFFAFQGALGEYFNSAFLFNISYTGYKNTFLFSNSLLFLKVLPILALIGYFLFRFYKNYKLNRKSTFGYSDFLLLWFAFSFYGAAFGGRTYSHYLLQLVPPFALLSAYLIYEKGRKYFLAFFIFVVGLVLLLRFLPFIPPSYYPNFVRYISGNLSFADFADGLDQRTSRNYALAGFLKEKAPQNSSLYLFSNQADIYFLSGLNPATSKIVFFHVASDSSGRKVASAEIEKTKPYFVVIDEPPPGVFAELENILHHDYNLYAYQNDARIYKISEFDKEAPF